ncbi:unnamed protein product [Camellia sinensis]
MSTTLKFSSKLSHLSSFCSLKAFKKMKLVFATLLLVTLLLSSSFVESTTDSSGICHSKCEVRCKDAKKKYRCLKYCKLCCEDCNYCVPSGTFGNRSECPCYRDKKNKRGKPKCP